MTPLVPQDWEPDTRLLTTAEAAHTIDRPIGTIYRWASLGRLTPYTHVNGRPYYLESDVQTVDADMRTTPP